MEAFILAERVLTAQHMSRRDHKDLKYLKKYDLPSQQARRRKLPNSKKPCRENLLEHPQPLASKKVKNLLSTITEGFGNCLKEEQSGEHKMDRYFSCTTDPSKNVWEVRKSKDALLFRNIEPQRQHYDANLSSVSPHSPCWTFPPHNRHFAFPPTAPLPTQPTPLRAKTAEKWRGKAKAGSWGKRASNSEEHMGDKGERKIFQHIRQRSGLGQSQKFQYCPLDLGRGTAQIFRKYHLMDEPYFKKFLSDIQNMAA